MQASLSTEALSGLIGQIYDCAIAPEGWEEVLGRLQQVAHTVNSVLTVYALPSVDPILSIVTGVEPEMRVRMEEYHSDVIKQWGGLDAMMAQDFDQPVVLSQMRPNDSWEDNRYFTEWSRPQGINDVVAFFVARDAGGFGAVGMGRHVDAGPVRREELDTLRLIVPHFQRAISISRMLDLQTIAVKSFEAALNAVPAGVILVDSGLHIIHANAAAEQMLLDGDAIASVKLGLRLGSSFGQHALEEAVRHAVLDETQIGRRGFGIPARTSGGEPMVLHVLPLRQGVLRSGVNAGAAAAIFMAPAMMPLPVPERALAALFELTPTEAKVLARIGGGKTIAATAEALGIGQGTVRSHLLKLFTKTGTGRQAELVDLVGSLSLFTRPSAWDGSVQRSRSSPQT